jgi:hypothetical protein
VPAWVAVPWLSCRQRGRGRGRISDARSEGAAAGGTPLSDVFEGFVDAGCSGDHRDTSFTKQGTRAVALADRVAPGQGCGAQREMECWDRLQSALQTARLLSE